MIALARIHVVGVAPLVAVGVGDDTDLCDRGAGGGISGIIFWVVSCGTPAAPSP